MAAQLTMVATGLATIEAFNPYARQAGGLFGFRGGGMADEGANAASEAANSASKAASHGAGRHMEAARAHANAATHANRVANRSKVEYAMATARGDKLSADAHAKELERASRTATFHEMESAKEASTPDTPDAGTEQPPQKSRQSTLGRITRATLRVAGGTATAVGTTAAVGGAGAAVLMPAVAQPLESFLSAVPAWRLSARDSAGLAEIPTHGRSRRRRDGRSKRSTVCLARRRAGRFPKPWARQLLVE